MKARRTTSVGSRLVLCYHAVSPAWEHRLSIHTELLLRQVQALARFRPVSVSFDDAFRNAAAVFPALRELGIPIQIFACTGFARNGSPLTIPELETADPVDLSQLETMSWDELRTHAADSVQIGSHTVTHPHLTSLSDAELRRELSTSKEEIETEVGRPCTAFAYPYGEYDDRITAAARSTGYTRAYALWNGSKSDPYAVPRLDLYRRHSAMRALLMTTPLHRLVA